jgi:hypothetical protein
VRAGLASMGLLAVGLFVLGGTAAPASAVDGLHVFSAHCPAGKIAQISWQNTKSVWLYVSRRGSFSFGELNDKGEFTEGAHTYNTGLTDIDYGWQLGTLFNHGDVITGTIRVACVNFQA